MEPPATPEVLAWLTSTRDRARVHCRSFREVLSMVTGCCIICGIKGTGAKDFICGQCGDPERITHFCDGCRRWAELDIEAIDVIQKYTKKEIPRRNGVAIKTSHCRRCGDRNKDVEVGIFLVQPLLLN
jgi:hypothetical protein